MEDQSLLDIMYTEARKLSLKKYPAALVPGTDVVMTEQQPTVSLPPPKPEFNPGPMVLVVYTQGTGGTFVGTKAAQKSRTTRRETEWKINTDVVWQNHPAVLYQALEGPKAADRYIFVPVGGGSGCFRRRGSPRRDPMTSRNRI